MRAFVTGFTTQTFNGYPSPEGHHSKCLSTVLPIILRDLGIQYDHIHTAKDDINRYDKVFIKLWDIEDHKYNAHVPFLISYLQHLKDLSKVVFIQDHPDFAPAENSMRRCESSFIQELMDSRPYTLFNYYHPKGDFEIDPSIYCNVNTTQRFIRPRWIYGSLAAPLRDHAFNMVDVKRITDLKETELFDEIAKHGLVVMNQYEYDTPDIERWWRIRYYAAANLGAAVYASERDQKAIYQGSYWLPHEIEADRSRIARLQSEMVLDTTEMKPSIRRKIEKLF